MCGLHLQSFPFHWPRGCCFCLFVFQIVLCCFYYCVSVVQFEFIYANRTKRGNNKQGKTINPQSLFFPCNIPSSSKALSPEGSITPISHPPHTHKKNSSPNYRYQVFKHTILFYWGTYYLQITMWNNSNSYFWWEHKHVIVWKRKKNLLSRNINISRR